MDHPKTALLACFCLVAGCSEAAKSGGTSAVDASAVDAGHGGALGAGGQSAASGGKAGGGGNTSSGGGGTGLDASTQASSGGGGTRGSGGASGASAGTSDAGKRVVVCPTKPPYDESDAELVLQCTKPVAVAVGNALRRLTSFDGHAWQYEAAFSDGGPDQNENSHRDVAIANGVVVITGDGGVLSSQDAGMTYTKVLDVRNHDSAIAVFRGAFWVVGSALTATSTDGVTWQKWAGATQVPGGLKGGWDCSALAASGDRLVAVTGRNNARRVFDGTTWTESVFGSEYGTLSGLAFGGGHFALIGYACCDTAAFAGLRAASTNGDDWTVKTNASSGSSYRFGDLFWDGARFVATASQYDKRTFVSTDGLAYTTQTSTTGIGTIAKLGNDFLGSSDGVFYTSPDTKTWTEAYRAADGQRWGITRIKVGTVLK